MSNSRGLCVFTFYEFYSSVLLAFFVAIDFDVLILKTMFSLWTFPIFMTSKGLLISISAVCVNFYSSRIGSSCCWMCFDFVFSNFSFSFRSVLYLSITLLRLSIAFFRVSVWNFFAVFPWTLFSFSLESSFLKVFYWVWCLLLMK